MRFRIHRPLEVDLRRSTPSVSIRSAPLLRPGTTVDDMVRILADDIVHGALPPGTRLDEGSLGARFKVSRTPVREALRELNAMGLVERPPNRRAVVTALSRERMHAMFEAMAELEAAVSRLAAERMSAEERIALLDGHQQSEALVQRGAVREYQDYNAYFHRLLYAGCHSDYLAELVTRIKYRLSPFRRAQFELPDRLRNSWLEHDRIVDAILRGAGHEAAQHARAHILTVGLASTHFAGEQHT